MLVLLKSILIRLSIANLKIKIVKLSYCQIACNHRITDTCFDVSKHRNRRDVFQNTIAVAFPLAIRQPVDSDDGMVGRH